MNNIKNISKIIIKQIQKIIKLIQKELFKIIRISIQMSNKTNPIYLDGKQQFIKNNYEPTPISTTFYLRYLCIDSRPPRFEIQSTLPITHDGDYSQNNILQDYTYQNECYIYVLEQLGSVYKSVYEQYQQIIGYPVNLQKPTTHTIQLFRKVSTLYRNYYGSDNLGLVIRYIFGDCSDQIQKFYMDYIYQKQSDQQETVINQYKQSTQAQIKEYLSQTCKFLPKQQKERNQFCNRFSSLLDKRLQNFNIKTSDSRFQDLIQMIRAVNCMFGFEIFGQKYEGIPSYHKNSLISLSPRIIKQNNSQQIRELNKLIIKTTLIQFKKAPVYEINTKLFQSFYRQQISLSKQNTTFYQEVQKQSGVFNLETLVSLFQNKDSIYKIIYPLSKVKFAIFITSQIIEYQMLTGSQYPGLNPLNIFYNSITDNFVLSATPVIIKGLGYQHRTYSSSNFMQNFYREQHMERDFSIENQIKENSARIILLMHYLEQKKWEIGKFKKSQLNDPEEWIRTLYKKISENQLKKILGMEQSKQKQFEQKQIQFQKQLQERISTDSDNQLGQAQTRLILLAKQKRQQNKNYICNGLVLKQVIFENIFAKTLLLKCVPSKKLPTLIDIDQKMHLNCHISDLSPSRTQYVLHMRCRMLNFLYKIVTDFRDRMDQLSLKQKKQVSNTMRAELNISQRIIFQLVMISSLELQTILRKQDSAIEQEVFENIQKFLKNTKDKEYMKKNFIQTGKNKPQFQLFLDFQLLLVNKLRYVCETWKIKQNNKQMNLNYSKILWKMITLSLQNELFRDVIINVYNRYFQMYNEKNLQSFSIIIQIFFLTLVKLNHENIFWFEHYVFKEVKDILYKKRLNKGYFDKILNEINKKPTSNCDSLWKGMIWDEEKQYLNVYFD